MKHWRWLQGIGLGILMASGMANAAEPRPHALQPIKLAQSYTDLVAVSLFQHYQAGYPAPILTDGLSSRQIDTIHYAFVSRLMEESGAVVGYKAALTNPTAQTNVGISHPLYGFLLEEMLLDSGASLPIEFGSRPQAEGDLMVRVGSAAINQAETDLELLAGLDAVIPFLELPDLIYQEGANINAGALIAVNLGARFGVMGDPVALAPDDSGLAQLSNIRVVLNNEQGQFLAEGNSTALLGHPINVVRWLRDTLQTQQVDLKPGDLLSLGSVTSLVSIADNNVAGVEARYFGLNDKDRAIELTVNFDVPDGDN